MSKPQPLFNQLGSVPAVLELTGPARAVLDTADSFETSAREIHGALSRRGTIWLFGNGGSAAIASHIANDVIGSGRGFANALSDPPIVTALSNDHGYAEVYVRQLRTCLRSDDLAIAISSSGASQNILLAAQHAAGEVRLVTLSGMAPNNPLRNLGHLNLYVPFDSYGAIEISHLAVLHECVSRALRMTGP